MLSSIASTLADKAATSNDPRVEQLSTKFAEAAKTGDLSGVKPHSGHHHHHHAHAAPSTSSDAASTSTTSGKAASYARSGSDPMAQLESIIGDAMSSAGA